MSQPTPNGNTSQENDRLVKLPIRTKDGQEAMDPTEEPSGEKIRSDTTSPQTISLLICYSKSEQKRRAKEKEREEKKTAKAATAPPQAEKKVSAAAQEAELTPNVGYLPSLYHYRSMLSLHS